MRLGLLCVARAKQLAARRLFSSRLYHRPRRSRVPDRRRPHGATARARPWCPRPRLMLIRHGTPREGSGRTGMVTWTTATLRARAADGHGEDITRRLTCCFWAAVSPRTPATRPPPVTAGRARQTQRRASARRERDPAATSLWSRVDGRGEARRGDRWMSTSDRISLSQAVAEQTCSGSPVPCPCRSRGRGA